MPHITSRHHQSLSDARCIKRVVGLTLSLHLLSKCISLHLSSMNCFTSFTFLFFFFRFTFPRSAVRLCILQGVLLQSRTTAFTLCFAHIGSCCGCGNPSFLGELTVTPLFRGKTNCYRTLWRIDLNLISMTNLFMINTCGSFQVRFTMTKSHMIEDLFMINELQNKRACKLEHMLLILCS